MILRAATSTAHSNIALVKYWGKLERTGNYPAVPSLSLTLSELSSTTKLELDEQLSADEIALDGQLTTGRARERAVQVLDHFRALAGQTCFARVTSSNDFPTASGLASSASGFAALAVAANAAYGTGLNQAALSAVARAASASAARSLFGGWSVLEVGSESAEQLAPAEHWPLVLLVAVTEQGKKSIGSTEAMNLTRSTSPYYPAWIEHAQALFAQARQAVLDRDLPRLGAAMEQSTLMMHATMMTASPAVLYWSAGTIQALRQVQTLRASGIPCYFTMDAGPHVKVLCDATHGALVAHALRPVEGVTDLIVAQPGPPADVRLDNPDWNGT